jgi:hypothetical protein
MIFAVRTIAPQKDFPFTLFLIGSLTVATNAMNLASSFELDEAALDVLVVNLLFPASSRCLNLVCAALQNFKAVIAPPSS